ncbi:BTAD domain-containing putative transcriptional regulator [Saccharothrix sp. Mg75]|uniref:AfsR/SARP family transcriptional regulator n=1 Tax=Saccharothrix sp. Mg75 TaxID=3445357 RepID=UPI003EE8E303
MLEVHLLGEVAVHVDGLRVDPGPSRQRCVLAALAVDIGRVVPVERMVDRVWGEDPPTKARAVLATYISRLRRVLAGARAAEVIRRSGGYLLAVEELSVDLHRFRALNARSREADDAVAVPLLTEALGLWRGEALTGLNGEWVAAERDRLGRERLAAAHQLVDARLRLGQGEELVTELATRVEEHPLDERVAGQYLLALHHAGRTADALEHYRRLRERLVEELGVDPGAALRDLHRRILDEPAPSSAAVSTAKAVVVPRQLPAAPGAFAGRSEDVERLDAALTPSVTTVATAAVVGTGGIGKTWLALTWAHRNLDDFPDGQLFVDLRGFSPDGAPMDPAVALCGFLNALGVSSEQIPVDTHARSALFRSLVADKRVLIVLDNAANTDQVIPLLPGSSTCTALITSRNHLQALVTGRAARHVSLDMLTESEAHALLTARLGPARVGAEPTAVRELVRLCGGLPLALGVIASRAAMRPQLPLATLTAELRDFGFGMLGDADPTACLPTVLSWSHHALPPEQATAFALLAAAPGPDIGLPAAASLTGLAPADTRAALHGLEQASLVEQDAHGRYRMHDLIRQYAAALPVPDADAAQRRVIGYYVHTADIAARLVHPHASRRSPAPAEPGCVPERPDSQQQAWAWFRREQACALAAQRVAADRGDHLTAYLLMFALYPFHHMSADFTSHVTACRIALSGVRHLQDPVLHCNVHRFLGEALCSAGQHDEGVRYLNTALHRAQSLDQPAYLSKTHFAFALAWMHQGRYAEALRSAGHALRSVTAPDSPLWTAKIRTVAANSAVRLGRHELATAHCLAALPVQREHGDRDGEVNSVFVLGLIALGTGDPRNAATHFRAALELSHQQTNTYLQADLLDRLAEALYDLGEHQEAHDRRRAASALYRLQGRNQEAARVQ